MTSRIGIALLRVQRFPRPTNPWMALLFESAFDLAEAEPDWALQCMTDNPDSGAAIGALTHLAGHTDRGTITHAELNHAFTRIYAARRETDERLHNQFYIPFETLRRKNHSRHPFPSWLGEATPQAAI